MKSLVFYQIPTEQQFGTLLNHKNNPISHSDLVWHYQLAFEAMANVEYQKQQNKKLFDSEIIRKLKQWNQQNIKLNPTDFKQIPLKCIPCMIKHGIFNDWEMTQTYEAILNSIQTNKAKRDGNQLLYLVDSISKLTEMGSVLYPFCKIQYSEEIVKTLSEKAIILYTKYAGIGKGDIAQSQLRFLNEFHIESLPMNIDELQDLNILGKVFSLSYSKEETFFVIKSLWKTRDKFKQRVTKALEECDINHFEMWERNITKMINAYL